MINIEDLIEFPHVKDPDYLRMKKGHAEQRIMHDGKQEKPYDGKQEKGHLSERVDFDKLLADQTSELRAFLTKWYADDAISVTQTYLDQMNEFSNRKDRPWWYCFVAADMGHHFALFVKNISLEHLDNLHRQENSFWWKHIMMIRLVVGIR